MRIAILSWTSRPVGGVGSYLRIVIPALARLGHDIAFWHELGDRPGGDPFGLPAGSPSWSVDRIGLERALDDLGAWRPDVLVSHGLIDPEVEGRTLLVAPAVFYVHGYYGTCISGAKMFKSPTPIPCSRRFGWPCLVNYYPRRCGGWSPITMIREFHRQSERLQLLPRYKALIAYSTHMQRELAHHGIDATYLPPPAESRMCATGNSHDRDARRRVAARVRRPNGSLEGRELSYWTRCRQSRGPSVGRVEVTFAGDGPARPRGRPAATGSRPRARRSDLSSRDGSKRRVGRALRARRPASGAESVARAVRVVGPEAGRQRLPAAAFAVGGIPDWLRPGINGFLAPGDPPTARGLAEAIIACLENPETHARLL